MTTLHELQAKAINEVITTARMVRAARIAGRNASDAVRAGREAVRAAHAAGVTDARLADEIVAHSQREREALTELAEDLGAAL